MRALYQGGMGMVARFGDLISESSLESIQSFEKYNLGKLLKERIATQNCEVDDVSGLLCQRVIYKMMLGSFDTLKECEKIQNCSK
jgi:hypothetical protein